MKIIINEHQSERLGRTIIKLLKITYKDILCDAKFDSEPDDDGKYWVNLYFSEDWYDSLPNGARDIKVKSGEIRHTIYQFIGVDVRTGISLKNC